MKLYIVWLWRDAKSLVIFSLGKALDEESEDLFEPDEEELLAVDLHLETSDAVDKHSITDMKMSITEEIEEPSFDATTVADRDDDSISSIVARGTSRLWDVEASTFLRNRLDLDKHTVAVGPKSYAYQQ